MTITGVIGFLAASFAGIAVGVLVVGLVPGSRGVALGALMGAAAYAGVTLLFSTERRLRGRAVSEIPEGERAAAAIDEAREATDAVAKIAARVADPAIRKQAGDFVEATRGLIGYTEENPATFRVLRHFSGTYSDQARQLLSTYLDIERSGAREQLASARTETYDAFCLLEKTAAGELSRAVASDALSLKASAAAIDKLASMDGYEADAAGDRGAGGAGKAAGAGGAGAATTLRGASAANGGGAR